VLRLLRELAAGGRTVLVSTHDDRVTNLADRVVQLAPKTASGAAQRRTSVLGAGTVLFRQGDPSDLVYVVDKGELELVLERIDGTEEVLAVVGPGAYFGELGPVLGLPRSATARARETSRVTGLPVREFRDRFGPHALIGTRR